MDAAGRPDLGRRAGPALALILLGVLSLLVIAAAIAVSTLGLGTSGAKVAPSVVDPGRAIAIARAFWVAGHPADVTLSDVVVDVPAAAASKTGRASWRVKVGGNVTERSGITYNSVMWLSIDMETGAVTIEAQG